MEKDKHNIEGGATLWARQTIESDIFTNKPDKWFKIWFYLINRVSHKDAKNYSRGETFLFYDWIKEATKATPDQVKKCVAWLKATGMISTRRSTRGILIKVNNYHYFQTLDNYYSNVKAPDEALDNKERHRDLEATAQERAPQEAPEKEPENSEYNQKNNEQEKEEAPQKALQKHQRSTREAPRYYKNEKNDKNKNKVDSKNNLRAKPAEAEIVDEKELAEKKLAADVQEIFDIFYNTINPNINYSNTTSRKACEFMIKKYGVDSVKNAAGYAVKIQGEPYAPTITTPYQLKEKMSALVIFKSREGTAKNSKGKTILGL